MRLVPYYACCGAYFLCDLTKESIQDPNTDANKLPQEAYIDNWNKRTYFRPDYSKASLAYHVKTVTDIAYLFSILKPEEKELGDMLVERGFELMATGPTRLLYCLKKDEKLGYLALKTPEKK